MYDFSFAAAWTLLLIVFLVVAGVASMALVTGIRDGAHGMTLFGIFFWGVVIFLARVMLWH